LHLRLSCHRARDRERERERERDETRLLDDIRENRVYTPDKETSREQEREQECFFSASKHACAPVPLVPGPIVPNSCISVYVSSYIFFDTPIKF
jgi:hypothetical protein